MMPEGKQTDLAFMSVVILSFAEVQSVSMLQLQRQTDMKYVGRRVVFMCYLQEIFISGRWVNRDTGSLKYS